MMGARKQQFSSLRKEQHLAQQLAHQAGRLMLAGFNRDLAFKRKTDDSPVTAVDEEINQLVIEEISATFPDDGVIGEEKSTADYGSGRRWFCDPIDGTKAFVWGTPTAMFSLGLVIDGQPQFGLVHDPFLERTFVGARGEGSFCNGEKLAVSSQRLSEGYLAVTSSVTQVLERPDYLLQLKDAGARFATFSGAVYKTCLVAEGRFTGYLDKYVNPHDMAASHVILEEAGGVLTDWSGQALDYSKPFRGTIISNGVVHEQLLMAVSQTITEK